MLWQTAIWEHHACFWHSNKQSSIRITDQLTSLYMSREQTPDPASSMFLTLQVELVH